LFVALWVWIVVVAGLALLVWLLFALVGTPGRRRAARREKAGELRRAAEEKLVSAARREVTARQESAAADRERQAAERAMEEADAVDPDATQTSNTTGLKR
jgi:peptidoglycan/LPS O-acetylase OafA/YrhL